MIERVLAEAREAARQALEATDEVRTAARNLPRAARAMGPEVATPLPAVPATAAITATAVADAAVPTPTGIELERSRWGQAILVSLHNLADASVRGSVEASLAFELSLRAAAHRSLKALASDLAKYGEFCAAHTVTGLPAAPSTVVAFIEQLQAEKYSYASVARFLASIAKVHRMFGIEPPTAAAAVRARLREYRRVRGVRQVQARALRLKGEDGIDGDAGRGLCVENVIRACDTSLTGLRDAALLSMAYDGGLRVSELTGAEVAHLRHDRKTGEGRLFLPQSKTDQEGAGRWAWLSAPTMVLIARWRQAARLGAGPLFRRVRVGVSRTGARTSAGVGIEPLTTEGVAHILRAAIRRAVASGFVDLEGPELAKVLKSVSTHSFRVGLTQDLYAAGGDTTAIMQSLRWKSPATALSYSRELGAAQGAAARLLRGRRQLLGVNADDEPVSAPTSERT